MEYIEKRNYGLDMLRCLSMFFVIVQHILGQGGIMEHAYGTGSKYFILSFFQILSYCAVDLYGITTGYLMCQKRFRLARVGKIWLTTVFWSVTVSCVFFLTVPESRTIKEMISMFLPILRGRYWFFTAYFAVMLLSPVLNLLIRNLSLRQFRLMLAVLLLLFGIIPIGSLGYDVMRLSGGNHFSWMVVLYLIGGYIRTNIPPKKTLSKKHLLGYFGFAALHLFYKIAVCTIGLGHYRDLMLTCLSPLMVAETLCIFLYFRDMGASNSLGSTGARILDYIVPGVYAVYIIHVHPLVFWNADLIRTLRPWDAWNTLSTLAGTFTSACMVFLTCVVLDHIRQSLFRTLKIDDAVEVVFGKIETIIRTYIF